MPRTVALSNTIVARDHKIWKLFPGEGYKFAKVMIDERVVFADVRGLPKLGLNPKSWQSEKLEEVVSRDRWSRQNADRDEPTDRRVSAADRSTATFVKGLLLTAKLGDLVLVPQEGATGFIRIGQFIEEPGIVAQVTAVDRRSERVYYGRKVRWLGAVSKRRVPSEVLERVQTPVTFFDMGDAGRLLFYREAFGSFSYDGDNYAEFITQKDVFTSRDSRNLSTWFELVEVLEASLRDKFIAAKIKDRSLRDVIDDLSIDEVDRVDLAININSPGTVLLHAVTQTPLVALALYPMAVQALPYQEAKNVSIKVEKAGSASIDCEGSVAASVRQIMDNLGAKKWVEACEIATRASEQTTLRAKSRLNSPANSARRSR